MSNESSPRFLNVQELACLLRIGRRQAYEAVNSGLIPSFRIGRSIRIPTSAVEDLTDWRKLNALRSAEVLREVLEAE